MLFIVLNRGPKEDGARKAKAFVERRQRIRWWNRVLAVSPVNDGDSGNGKIVHLEQPGEPTRR